MRAIISGGTKGIGLAIAEQLAGEGYDLALCSRQMHDLLKTQKRLQQIRPDAEILIHETNVRNKQEIKTFVDFVRSKWDRIDVLINNAGIFISGKITEEEEGTLEEMIETNLYGVYYMTRAVLPAMLPARRGHIINMASIASIMAYPNGGSYSISKFGLLGFSKVLREELKPTGIKVTALLPGATWSDSWAGSDLPYERLIETRDIAKIVSSILSLSDSADIEELIVRPQLGDL
ncbi:MAG TPA: SDR family oxidoreductase [Saprospiraceae bacterium]|nr:SDR family oxidoreductase [Saprospiraceae bacterium]HRV83828.1 SDR family oxidoreductase [Saprospiraceae bacterium]